MVLEENSSLKENINFINSFDLFNNCLIIEYKSINNQKIISHKIWDFDLNEMIKFKGMFSNNLTSLSFN